MKKDSKRPMTDELFDALSGDTFFSKEDKIVIKFDDAGNAKSEPHHSAEEDLANAILFGDGSRKEQCSCGSKFDADKDAKDIADKLLGKDKEFSRQVDELTAALWNDLLASQAKITPTLTSFQITPTLVSSMNDRRLLAIIATSLLDKEKSHGDEKH